MQLTLSEVEQQFSQWRSTRSHTKEATPEPFLESARSLLSAHKASEIARTLGINPRKLKSPSSLDVCGFTPIKLSSSSLLEVSFSIQDKAIQIRCEEQQFSHVLQALSQLC